MTHSPCKNENPDKNNKQIETSNCLKQWMSGCTIVFMIHNT